MDPVESVESVDLVEPCGLADLVDLCGFYSNFLLTVCLGIQVECVSFLSPFGEYKQVFFPFYSKRSIPDRGRPAVASPVQKIA